MRPIALLLVAILLAWGCGWRRSAAGTLHGLTAAGKVAHVFVLKECGPGGSTAAKACLERKDGECKPLKRCETAVRSLHALHTAVLLAKLGLAASEKQTALAAVEAAVAAMGPVTRAIKEWTQ
jgi:hypothetical protein